MGDSLSHLDDLLSCPYTLEKKRQGETGVSKSEKPMNIVLEPAVFHYLICFKRASQ